MRFSVVVPASIRRSLIASRSINCELRAACYSDGRIYRMRSCLPSSYLADRNSAFAKPFTFSPSISVFLLAICDRSGCLEEARMSFVIVDRFRFESAMFRAASRRSCRATRLVKTRTNRRRGEYHRGLSLREIEFRRRIIGDNNIHGSSSTLARQQ